MDKTEQIKLAEQELPPCPFCGKKAVILDYVHAYRLECSYCEIGIDGYVLEHLIETWTERV